jgi:hypothetical protein
MEKSRENTLKESQPGKPHIRLRLKEKRRKVYGALAWALASGVVAGAVFHQPPPNA